MEILFIRHSKTEVDPRIPIANWRLSNDGIKLAKDLSANSIIKRTEIFYTSPQSKAVETVIFLAKPNGIPVKENADLTEVTSFTGTFEKDYEKHKQNVKNYYLGKIDRISGGETQQEAIARFTRALESIVTVEKGKKYVGIVSHGNILTLYSAQYKNIDCYVMHAQIKQPDMAIFDWEKKKFISFFGEII